MSETDEINAIKDSKCYNGVSPNGMPRFDKEGDCGGCRFYYLMLCPSVFYNKMGWQ